jgi:hypothetical protein
MSLTLVNHAFFKMSAKAICVHSWRPDGRLTRPNQKDTVAVELRTRKRDGKTNVITLGSANATYPGRNVAIYIHENEFTTKTSSFARFVFAFFINIDLYIGCTRRLIVHNE